MKSYTDISQSKKLAEILPFESADIRFCFSHTLDGRITGHYPMIGREPSLGTISCWSLAALLGVFTEYNLQKTDWGNGKIEYKIVVYVNDESYESGNYDNPIDACYEMILKLNEPKML